MILDHYSAAEERCAPFLWKKNLFPVQGDCPLDLISSLIDLDMDLKVHSSDYASLIGPTGLSVRTILVSLPTLPKCRNTRCDPFSSAGVICDGGSKVQVQL